MLRDRLVCGVNDEQIQRGLLAESCLDFKKALEIATSVETAVKSSRELANQMAKEDVKSESSITVHRVDNYSQRNQQSLKPECGRCGGKHYPQQCKFLEAECFLCKKRGHIARKCRSNTKSKTDGRNEKQPISGVSGNYLGMEAGEIEEEDDNYGIFNLTKPQEKPYVVDILLGKESLKMEIDTGAAMSIINVQYKDVFLEELGTFSGPKKKIHVAEDAQLKYFKARPVPYALKEKIENELDRLVEEGTIEPVQFVDWAAPIVPIVKEDKSIRICGDYKVTVNQVAKLVTIQSQRQKICLPL